ncbi:MAG: NAD-dependent epimerase/dehydratase family protein [Candidatus Levybacteria bacterium]|nr:NAD-dependent epimerase/dehydratase family protein [Candidatus Levybacteria bacterium]
MTKNTSYLITGGYGLIGSALANSLEGSVTILTRSEKHKERLARKNTKIILKDLANIQRQDLEGIDIIYHLASTVDNYNVLTNPYLDVETNINGTIRLLETCRDLKKKPKIVFLSTFFVYGNVYDQTKIPINEESKTNPLAIYPATKLCAESIIKLYSRLYDIPYLICRLTNVYSENEDYDNKKKGVLNYIIMQAVKGETLSVYRGGNFCRDYIHVDDIISALNFLENKNIDNDTFLIGFGKSVLFKDMISCLHEITEKKSEIVEIEPPEFHKAVGITNFVANTSKISRLGWKPTIDYKKGIKRIVNKYKSLINT